MIIDKILFKTRGWQVFLLFVGVWILEVTFHVKIWIPFVALYVVAIGWRLNGSAPLTYVLASVVFIMSIIYLLSFLSARPNFDMMAIAPVMLLSYYYIIWFVARTLKQRESQRHARLKEYFIDIFFFGCFCPIGLWMIQPRLNALHDQ